MPRTDTVDVPAQIAQTKVAVRFGGPNGWIWCGRQAGMDEDHGLWWMSFLQMRGVGLCKNGAGERLERVLRVAEALIVERGFANLNMREVADIADVNISTIYSYFPNSQSLLRVISLRFIEESEASTQDLYERISQLKSSPDQIVDHILDFVIDFYHRHPNWNAIWRGMQSDNDLMAMDIEDTRVNSSPLSLLLQKVNPDLEDSDLIAMMLITINGAVIRLAAELSVRERETIYRQLRQLVRRMLIS